MGHPAVLLVLEKRDTVGAKVGEFEILEPFLDEGRVRGMLFNRVDDILGEMGCPVRRRLCRPAEPRRRSLIGRQVTDTPPFFGGVSNIGGGRTRKTAPPG